MIKKLTFVALFIVLIIVATNKKIINNMNDISSSVSEIELAHIDEHLNDIANYPTPDHIHANIEIQSTSDLSCVNPGDVLTFTIINRVYISPTSGIGTNIDNFQMDIGGMTTITWSSPDITGLVTGATSTDGGTVSVIMVDPADADADTPSSGDPNLAMLSNSPDPTIDDVADVPCTCHPGSAPGPNSCPISGGTCTVVPLTSQIDWIFTITYTVPVNSNHSIGSGSIIDGQADYILWANGSVVVTQTAVYSAESQFLPIDILGVGVDAGPDQTHDLQPDDTQVYQLAGQPNPIDPNCTGTWTGAPAGSTYNPDANTPDAIVTFPVGTEGVYPLTWAVDCGGCTDEDEMTFEISVPVELAFFTATATLTGVQLDWRTESEIDNLGFVLERKTEDTEWMEIASYKDNDDLLGQGTVSSATDYTYNDDLVEAGKTYEYRLADVDYNGVVTYHSTRPVTVEQAPLSTKVEEFSVLPAYPNPFNPSTTIRFGLENESKVSIQIYDITGKLISTLLNGEQTPGWHSIIWNGTNQHGDQVPAGIYISRISSGNNIKTNKLMLLK